MRARAAVIVADSILQIARIALWVSVDMMATDHTNSAPPAQADRLG
jgi:hypothetical protein